MKKMVYKTAKQDKTSGTIAINNKGVAIPEHMGNYILDGAKIADVIHRQTLRTMYSKITAAEEALIELRGKDTATRDDITAAEVKITEAKAVFDGYFAVISPAANAKITAEAATAKTANAARTAEYTTKKAAAAKAALVKAEDAKAEATAKAEDAKIALTAAEEALKNAKDAIAPIGADAEEAIKVITSAEAVTDDDKKKQEEAIKAESAKVDDAKNAVKAAEKALTAAKAVLITAEAEAEAKAKAIIDVTAEAAAAEAAEAEAIEALTAAEAAEAEAIKALTAAKAVDYNAFCAKVDNYSIIDKVWAFIITKDSSVQFDGGKTLVKAILAYHNNFYDVDANHAEERTTLKRQILDFVNLRLKDCTFKIQTINRESLNYIIEACRVKRSNGKNGLKSIKLEINDKNITAIQHEVLLAVFTVTIGALTGYYKKPSKNKPTASMIL